MEGFWVAEAIRLKVSCHACGNVIEGSAPYGKGHYVPTGVVFDFVATGKQVSEKGRRVRGEVTCICPHCEVKNKYNV